MASILKNKSALHPQCEAFYTPEAENTVLVERAVGQHLFLLSSR
jgi:hypothetical protein